MPFEELTNAPSPRSLNPPSSIDFNTQENSASATEQAPWLKGRKALVPVPVGEARRLRMKAGVLAELSEVATKGDSPEEPLSPTSSDAVARARRLVEENRRLRDRLASAEKSTETLGRELSELRGAHNVVVAERDSLQLELAKQEDELFILRQADEERAPGVGELRTQLALAADAKSQLEAQHELALADAQGETARLRTQLEKAESDLEQSRADQNEQHLACLQLMEEQEKLELAYEEAVLQLDEFKRQHALDEVPDDEMDVDAADQSWDQCEVDEVASQSVVSSSTMARKHPFGRVLTRRGRTRSQPLLSAPIPAQQDVAAVKNDVEQLKQTIALLVRERQPPSDLAYEE